MRSNALNTLIDMHTYGRPHGSDIERAFIKKFIAPIPGAYRDHYGNYHVAVGTSSILWSCHTDTVHWDECRQTLHYDESTAVLSLARKSKKTGNVLGADDTAGVFLCREMILRGIPGHYIFHYGEESGGIGSRQLAENHAEWLKGFTAAIALDRSGFNDIITYQGAQRCASDAFAASLATRLNPHGLHYVANDGGIYTDTAEYTHLIPECSNLSVGYFRAHSNEEVLYCSHVMNLLTALLSLDHSDLIIERDPTVAPLDLWENLYPITDDYVMDELPIYNAQYLDPAFADVQRALRRERKDRRENHKIIDWPLFSKRVS